MAVAIEFGSQGAADAVAGVATISGLDFNAEAADRIIAVSISRETAVISTVEIAGVAATVRGTAAFSTTARAEIWAAAIPTGTSGDVVVTYTASTSAATSVSTYSITGADETPTDSDSANGNGADISITALTVPTDGAALAAFCNVTSTTATSWTGATVAHDTQVSGTFAHRHSSAITTTAGTNTITADAATAGQALVGVAWGPAAGGATEYTADLTAGSFSLTGSSLTVPTARNAALTAGAFTLTGSELTPNERYSADLSPGSFALTGAELDALATGVRPGPADDRPARRRRDQQIREAYWAQRQREANEEAERKRLDALAEAERALERAEDAKRADAKRKAVRDVFAALRRAAVTEQAREDAQKAEQAALAAIAGRQTEQQRAIYMAALDQLNTEIEAIGAEITRLYRRRREEEEFLIRLWAAS